MKKIFVTTFATAFVMALALPAVAQSVCGAVGTAGLPSCTSARSGVPCCVPPRGQIYNKGKGKKLVSQHMHVNEIQESTAPIYEGPQDFNPGSGNGNGNGTVDPSSYKAKKNVATATVPAEKGIGGTGATPTVAPSAVKSASAPAVAVTATAAAPAAAAPAASAPAAAASSAKAASAGASRGGGAAAKSAR